MELTLWLKSFPTNFFREPDMDPARGRDLRRPPKFKDYFFAGLLKKRVARFFSVWGGKSFGEF